ncbi:MAG TPA: hypothetical protein PKY05_13485, partial [Fibrobacteria bacterium]|nr:hypothetical protein [Fibrobacteria bacterium]
VSVVFRARTLGTGLGSLWLLDWTDSTQSAGWKWGIGAGTMSLWTSGSERTAVWESKGWSWYAMVVTRDSLRIHADGREVLRAAVVPGSRKEWVRRFAGAGGAMEIAALLVWNRAIDGAVETSP